MPHASHHLLLVWCECISVIANFGYKELILLENGVCNIRRRLYACFCLSLPPSQTYADCEELPLYGTFELKPEKRKIRDRLRNYVKDQHSIDLIDKLLALDPQQRVAADEALNHDFFWSDPLPTPLGHLLSQQTTSNFEFLAPRRTGAGAVAALSAASGAPQPGAQSRAVARTNLQMGDDFNSSSFDPVY